MLEKQARYGEEKFRLSRDAVVVPTPGGLRLLAFAAEIMVSCLEAQTMAIVLFDRMLYNKEE